MKRILYLSSMLAAAFFMSACNEKEPVGPEEKPEAPVIQLAETGISIESEGRNARIAYQVENAVEGVSLKAETDAEWIEGLTVKARVIEFNVGKNESGAFRTADIILTYEGAEDAEISVSQEQWNAPVTLTIHETDATSVTFSVAVADEEMTWIGQIVGKEWYETYESEQAVFEADLAYFASEASYFGVSLKEYLAGIMIKGSKENLKYKGLDPLSEYILYVYGISAEGERTTALYTAQIATTEPYAGPITFTFDITEKDAIMDVTVTPSHDGVDYYWNMTTPETLAEYDSDLQTAVEKWLESRVNELLGYGDYVDREDFFVNNTTRNAQTSTYEGIVHTDYIFYAFKWDKECKVIGEVAFFEHKTGDVTPSDNRITVEISDITQSSFHIETQTTNSDPYFLIAEPASEMAGIDLENDNEVFHYFYDWLGTFYIWNYISYGNMGGNFLELKPDTEYNIVTFGYMSGALTTPVQIQKVRTLASGDPKDCKFEFTISNIKATSAEVEISPSDKGHYYYWDVFPADYTANMAKQQITKKFKEEYYSDMWDFRYELTISDDHGYLSYLTDNTSYKIGAVVIDRNADNLEFLGYVHFSDKFTTPEAKISATTVTCGFHEYYDGDEIAMLEPEKFGGMAGYPIIPLAISIDGDYAEYHYTIYDYIDGLEDPAKYPDSMLHEQLIEVGWSDSMSQYFRGKWDTPLMIAAMAIDLDGNYTTVYRKKFILTKDGAAPAENFVNNYGKSSTRSTLSEQLTVLPVRKDTPQRISEQVQKQDNK